MISLLGGNAQRLPNGNTLFVNSIQGALIEVTKSGAVAWRYANPVNEKGPARQGHLFSGLSEELAPIVMEVRRYPPSYPGLANRTLASQGVLELPAN